MEVEVKKQIHESASSAGRADLCWGGREMSGRAHVGERNMAETIEQDQFTEV